MEATKKKKTVKVPLTKEEKFEKKLRATTRRILAQRKVEEKELETFQEINRVLEAAEADVNEAPLPDSPGMIIAKEEVGIPKYAPGCHLIYPEMAGFLFNESSLEINRFISQDETLFGRSMKTVGTALFKKLLISRVFDLRSDGVKPGVSLYVLHLLASSPSEDLVLACAEFLQQFPCQLTVTNVLPLLLNLGIDGNSVWGSEFEYEPPSYLQGSTKGRDAIPYLNIEKLINYLTFCVTEKHMVCDQSVEPIIVVLSQLALDSSLRGSHLLPAISHLVSTLASSCSQTVSCDVIAEWLLRGHKHPLNQMEVLRLIINDDCNVQTALLRQILNNLLGIKVVLHSPIELQDLQRVVRNCRKQASNVLHVYVVIQLLIAISPKIIVTAKDVKAFCKELVGLDSLFPAGDCADATKLKGSTATLRTLLMIQVDE